MKHHIYFIAAVFLFTFLISSCSNDKDEMIPVSPQTEKHTDGKKAAFDYLESIPELKDAKIEYIFMSEGISITISSIPLKSAHLFVVIDIGEQSSQLFFLEYNNEAKLFIHSVPADIELQVKIYGFISKPTPILNQFPQNFSNISIKEWYISQSSIFVKSEFSYGIRDLFVELETREGYFLVYLDKPPLNSDTPYLEIPKYGDMQIVDLKLFGYSGFIDR